MPRDGPGPVGSLQAGVMPCGHLSASCVPQGLRRPQVLKKTLEGKSLMAPHPPSPCLPWPWQMLPKFLLSSQLSLTCYRDPLRPQQDLLQHSLFVQSTSAPGQVCPPPANTLPSPPAVKEAIKNVLEKLVRTHRLTDQEAAGEPGGAGCPTLEGEAEGLCPSDGCPWGLLGSESGDGSH